MITLYNAISADGFIARKDGGEDFIPDNFWQNFLSLCKVYGALIIGRKTYDTIQGYDKALKDSFEAIPIRKVVVSSNKNFNLKDGYILASTPEEAVALVPNALVSSGPTLNNYLLRNNLVKDIILNEVPVSIGSGIKPFDESIPQLKHIKIRGYKLD